MRDTLRAPALSLTQTDDLPHAGGMTVPEFARYLRVGLEKVRTWIKNRELRAVNVATSLCGRPRYVITPDALREFMERRLAGSSSPLKKRRKRQTGIVDFYPD